MGVLTGGNLGGLNRVRPRAWLRARGERAGQATAGLGYDWAMAVLASWLVGGAYLDGWAHNHIPQLETFFTPWHAVLYSGFFASFLCLLGTWLMNWRAGYGWRRAMPVGYGLSLLGGFIFLAGGLGDMLWHQLLGIEVGFEALLSPTHLMLGVGGGLILTGPFRAAWLRPDDAAAGRWRLAPMLISLALMLAMFTFFTANYHPFGETIAGENFRPGGSSARLLRRVLPTASYLNILLQSALVDHQS